jgi:hypothetical protein
MLIALEARLAAIIESEPLELVGEAYVGNYKLNDGRSIKKFILNKLRLNDKGKNIAYINLDTGNKIIISGNSAGKLAKHYKDGEIYQKTLAHIPQIIENMKFLEEMSAEKENAKFDKYSYYVMKAKIYGEYYTIFSTVGHNKDNVYYYQNVFEGTPKEVFEEIKNGKLKDGKYSRLFDILKNSKEEALDPSEFNSGDNSQ